MRKTEQCHDPKREPRRAVSQRSQWTGLLQIVRTDSKGEHKYSPAKLAGNKETRAWCCEHNGASDRKSPLTRRGFDTTAFPRDSESEFLSAPANMERHGLG